MTDSSRMAGMTRSDGLPIQQAALITLPTILSCLLTAFRIHLCHTNPSQQAGLTTSPTCQPRPHNSTWDEERIAFF